MLFRLPPEYTSAAPEMAIFPRQPTMYVPPPPPPPPPPKRNEPNFGISDAIDGYNNFSTVMDLVSPSDSLSFSDFGAMDSMFGNLLGSGGSEIFAASGPSLSGPSSSGFAGAGTGASASGMGGGFLSGAGGSGAAMGASSILGPLAILGATALIAKDTTWPVIFDAAGK